MFKFQNNKLSNPYLQACKHLEISHQDSINILGVDPYLIDQKTCFLYSANYKARKIAISVIQIYIQLFVISGGDKRFIAHWFSTRNFALEGIPKKRVKTRDGRLLILGYLNKANQKL